jgi:hypothetical protein
LLYFFNFKLFLVFLFFYFEKYCKNPIEELNDLKRLLIENNNVNSDFNENIVVHKNNNDLYKYYTYLTVNLFGNVLKRKNCDYRGVVN